MFTPQRAASRIVATTSALRHKALVGMQPRFRQVPPNLSRSTSATFMPWWAASAAIS